MPRSQKWKVITVVNILLLAGAAWFAYSQWQSYDNAVNYFGEIPYSDRFWLHPDNKFVEDLYTISEVVVTDVQLAYVDNGEISIKGVDVTGEVLEARSTYLSQLFVAAEDRIIQTNATDLSKPDMKPITTVTMTVGQPFNQTVVDYIIIQAFLQ